MTFQEAIESDIMDVFHSDEFAKKMEIAISGILYTVTPIVNYGGAQERTKFRDDHVQGIVLYDARMVIPFCELGFVPSKGALLEFDGNTYLIKKNANVSGEIVLDLEMYAE